MKLVNFLYARIAEDERRADILRERQQRSGMWSENTWDAPDVDYPDSWSRILSECEAKRRIIEAHDEYRVERLDDEFPGDSYDALCDADNDDFPCLTLRLLALPYADHPDFNPEWLS